jgi:predicted 2-oxoglutarate/Fe(II)-dependent dioxygenase YbiX/peroxiredoxin
MTNRHEPLLPGDPAPFFVQASTANPRFVFDTTGGRYLVLAFFGSAAAPHAVEALRLLTEERQLFDDERISFFGVSIDPRDDAEKRIRESVPGIRFFCDFDLSVSRLYGAADPEAGAFLPIWYVLDPNLRVRAVFPMHGDDSGRKAVADCLRRLPPVDHAPGLPVSAPVLLISNVFEPAFCRRLIELYEMNGGHESGVMKQIGGKTVGVMDFGHKRRADHIVEDADLQRRIQARIKRRVTPEIRKVHQFEATRMERYLVGCYDSETGGHFRPHRDNTTAGTAHRRFAVSINLNDDFSGGEVCFPEYGPRGYKMPAGGAVVFSCSLLHAVSRVTAGKRFAFLPFLYDETAAEIRRKNLHLVAAEPEGLSSEHEQAR